MKREDIIRLAREAGMAVEHGSPMLAKLEWLLTVVIKATAAAEREACAELCDELHWPWRMGDNSGPKECAAAIRARGQA